MSVLLVSPKGKGNTHDVMSYVEKNSEADLLVIGSDETADLKNYENIVIGSGVYGGDLHKNLQSWLTRLDNTSLHENVKFHALLTWFGRGRSDRTTLRKVGTLLETRELKLEDDHMTCFGGMGMIRGSHPNDEDRKKVLDWVKSIPRTT